MTDTLQTIIVALIVAIAAFMLWRSLRHQGTGCSSGDDNCDSACKGCPLQNSCNKDKNNK
ncbi:MAG: FeoB-associated Cys-rich membrane protein [Odoribacter sp.]|nr:FeoB-associated Cys-rich membrane protein [Odoribacter sp.]